MSNLLLMPGFGGTTVLSVTGGTTGADKLDCSRAATLAFQTTTHAGDATTITVQQTFDGVNFATLTTFSSTAGTIKQLAQSAGPFGEIRLQADGTTGANTITIVGLPMPLGV